MGLSEKSGSPFCILKEVERIAKNRAIGVKMVPKTNRQKKKAPTLC